MMKRRKKRKERKDEFSFEEQVGQLFDPNREPVDTELVQLSNLTEEELGSFKRAWANVETKRRRQITTDLVHLSEDNLCLDFSNVFLACVEDDDEDVRLQAVLGLEGEEDTSVISPLIGLLKDDSSDKIRAAAATVLSQFALLAELGKLPWDGAKEVYLALLAVVEDETESLEVKRRALEAIGFFPTPRVKELIEEAYHSHDIKLKASALYAMGRNCDLAWLPILVEEMDNTEAEIRYEVAEAYGELGIEETVPHLFHLAHDSDAQVRQAACRSLERLDEPEARQALHRLLSSPYDDVRETAKSALADMEFLDYG
jgi:HEAT repeat protein